MPWYADGVYPVPKTDSVLSHAGVDDEEDRQTTNTAISKMPRTVPSPAEVRMP